MLLSALPIASEKKPEFISDVFYNLRRCSYSSFESWLFLPSFPPRNFPRSHKAPIASHQRPSIGPNLVRCCTVRRKSVYDRSTCDANHRGGSARPGRLAGVAARAAARAGTGHATVPVRTPGPPDCAPRLLCLIISRGDYEVR